MIELVIKNYLDGHLDVPSFFEHQNGLKGNMCWLKNSAE